MEFGVSDAAVVVSLGAGAEVAKAVEALSLDESV